MSELIINEVIDDIISKVEYIKNDSSKSIIDDKEIFVEVNQDIIKVKELVIEVIKEGIIELKEVLIEVIKKNIIEIKEPIKELVQEHFKDPKRLIKEPIEKLVEEHFKDPKRLIKEPIKKLVKDPKRFKKPVEDKKVSIESLLDELNDNSPPINLSNKPMRVTDRATDLVTEPVKVNCNSTCSIC